MLSVEPRVCNRTMRRNELHFGFVKKCLDFIRMIGLEAMESEAPEFTFYSSRKRSSVSEYGNRIKPILAPQGRVEVERVGLPRCSVLYA